MTTAEEKELKSITKNLYAATKSVSNLGALIAVDMLSAREIDELRMLISSDDAKSLATERAKDSEVRGIYEELNSLGFITKLDIMSEDFHLLSINPKAHWAIYRHDDKVRRDAEKSKEMEDRIKADRRNDKVCVALGWVLGLVSAALLYVLEPLIDKLL